MTVQLAPAVPSLQAAAIDTASGRFLPPWSAFFRRFASGAPPIQAVEVGVSPLSWTAPGPGDLMLTGGAGVAVTLTRGRSTIAVPGGLVPVASGDVVTVSFTAAPVASFVPRVV